MLLQLSTKNHSLCSTELECQRLFKKSSSWRGQRVKWMRKISQRGWCYYESRKKELTYQKDIKSSEMIKLLFFYRPPNILWLYYSQGDIEILLAISVKKVVRSSSPPLMQTKTAQLCDFRWVCWKAVTPVASTDIHILKLSKSLNGPSVHKDIKHLHNWKLIHFDPCFTNKAASVPIHLGFHPSFSTSSFYNGDCY